MPQTLQPSFQGRVVRHAQARIGASAATAPLAWPVSALILLGFSGAFWFAAIEAAIHIF